MRKLAPNDIYAYGEYVFGHQPAPHHVEMMEFILSCIREHKDGVCLLPRGHAKTTWGDTILLSWLLAKNPNLRVGLISNTSTQAKDFSRAVRWTFENNDRFRDVFGPKTGTVKWTDAEWIQLDSPLHGTKDVSCYAIGAGGAIISKRFDLILCDDIIDEENVTTIDQLEKVENWFSKTLRPCRAPGGSIIVLGTRWGEGDLYEKLIQERKWPNLVRGAIYEEDGAQKALWPEYWPLDRLEAERADMGSAVFACAYLNDISGLMAGNVFRREWFQYFETLDPEKSYRIRMGVDLASSEKERADYTARVIVAEDEDYNSYVLSYYRDKRETGHREFVIDGWMAYQNMERIIIESNQFQSTLVQQLLDTTSLPVVGRKADVDKVTRARAIAARYEGRKVFHHRSLRETEFEIELLSFPKGHDDCVDALGYAMDLVGSRLVFGSVTR